jgi:hypothetical protein
MVTPEKLTTALPATNTLANFDGQESEKDQAPGFCQTIASRPFTLQNA